MLSPTFTLFAILICSSHIYIEYGESRPHHVSPQTINYIKDFTTDTNNDRNWNIDARYQPQLESLQEGEAAENEEILAENEHRQPSILSPPLPPLSPKPIIEATNFPPQLLVQKNSQRYQNTHHLNHQKFNPEQAISLLNSMRQTGKLISLF